MLNDGYAIPSRCYKCITQDGEIVYSRYLKPDPQGILCEKEDGAWVLIQQYIEIE